ncbi:MAG: signal peptidase I [Arthrobacter sp.]|nr:signal peptidase I [Arthrobacter sp.]
MSQSHDAEESRPLTRKQALNLERAARTGARPGPEPVDPGTNGAASHHSAEGTEAGDLPPHARRGAAVRRPFALRALRAAASTAVFLVLCLSLFIGVVAIALPALAGGTALTVQTSSMRPNYLPGTLVVIRPVEAASLRPGDVITYQLKSGEPVVVTHRVTQQLRAADGGYLFITQGDANPAPDAEPVREVQVRGKLWYAVPWVGHLSAAVTGHWRTAVIPLAVGALFAYAAWMFVSSARDKRKQRRAT